MKIVGPEDLDEIIADSFQRGLAPSVLVEVNGKIIDLTFLTLDRVKDEIEINLEFSGFYMIPSNYIIVNGDISLEKIKRALEVVSSSEDFKKNLSSSG